jgi:hypothetical protein
VSRLDALCLAIIGGAFLVGTQGCAIGNNARVSLGAAASIGYNAGSMSTPQESCMTNAVHRVGGGTVDAKAGAIP